MLKYDEVKWQQEKLIPMPLANHQITGPPPRHTEGAYWEFTIDANKTVGLKLTEVVAKETMPGVTEEVFASIEFTDLQVTFNDGAKEPFNLGAAFDKGKAKLQLASDGIAGEDKLFQRGLKLTLDDDFQGTCRVQVELSVVFRGQAADFDPGKSNVAMKIYPQIGTKWFKKGKKRVIALRGTVKLLAKPHTMHLHDESPQQNVAGFFTDSNASAFDHRKLRTNTVFPRTNRPDWSIIFDYVSPDLKKEQEIVGVYGPAEPTADPIRYHKHSQARSGKYPWPANQSEHGFLLVKSPRQGSYDNIHLHHFMGKDLANATKVAAPFCGEACFHLHWRWAPLSVAIAEPVPLPGGRGHYYRGWGKDPKTSVASSTFGAPLIPPNQHLSVALTHPDTKRHNDERILDPTNIKDLDHLVKAIWYTVDITDPLPAGKQQVILEQGCGYAFDYHDGVTAFFMRRFLNDVVDPDPPSPPTLLDLYNQIYEEIRYYYDANHQNPEPQVPPGFYHPTGAQTSMEDL